MDLNAYVSVRLRCCEAGRPRTMHCPDCGDEHKIATPAPFPSRSTPQDDGRSSLIDVGECANIIIFIVPLLAERVGFEPTLEFPLNTLSKRAPSATRPSLRVRVRILMESPRMSLDNLGAGSVLHIRPRLSAKKKSLLAEALGNDSTADRSGTTGSACRVSPCKFDDSPCPASFGSWRALWR